MLSPAPARISLLVVLEALLFLNYPVWDRVTAYANPENFALQLLFAATTATLFCHVCPAFLAAHWHAPPWLSSSLALWMILGNLLTIGLLAFRPESYTPYLVILASLVAAGVGPVRRVLALLLLTVGALLLTWAFYDKLEGLGHQNTRLQREPWGADFALELLFAAAPVLPLAWLLGRQAPGARTIWLTGLFGVALPMIVSFTFATAAQAAGWALNGRSKIFLGFTWALLPPAGLEEWYRGALYLSSASPMLVAAILIRELLPRGHGLLHTVWLAGGALLLGYIGAHSHWEGNADRAWALSLLLLSFASPIVYAVWRRRRRT